MLLSSESTQLWEPSYLSYRGPCCYSTLGLVQAVLPESKNMRKRIMGVLQELGRSCRLLGKFPAGVPGEQLQASAAVLVRRGANITSTTEVPPSEGNEARWDGRQEVIVP